LADRIAADVRQRLPGLAYTVTTIGNNAQQTNNLANIFVKMKPVEQRRVTQQEVMQLVRKDILPRYGSLRSSVSLVQAISTGAPAAAVIYYIAGPDLDRLSAYSQTAVEEMKKIPGVVDADSSLVVGKPELGVLIDRKRAADLGVSVADIAGALRILVGGA